MSTETLPEFSPDCRVLVVDDDPFTRNMIARGLGKLGISSVFSAESGEQARSLLEARGSVDLIFCDLGMPGEDGVTLMRNLAADHAGSGIVLISAISEKLLRVVGDLVAAHGLWLIGTLAKPLGGTELRQVLERWSAGPDQAHAARQPQLTVDRFRQAIQHGEIEVHVQPQCAPGDGRLLGVEALSRWSTPEIGLVFPDTFIPFATTHGLINELTDYVIRRVLDALAHWDEHGLHITAAINIAATTLHRVDLPDFIHGECAQRNLDVKRLILELTEAGIVDNLSKSLDVVSRLYLAGIELSLDDFGTGHATLSQLRQLPFSEIKLDRSFVGAMMTDPEARTIVESSCELAHRLGLRCVAEGVEDTEALAEVRRLTCSGVQGYLIARPMPIQDFLDWAREGAWKPLFSAGDLPVC